jgi:hypothetical protein
MGFGLQKLDIASWKTLKITIKNKDRNSTALIEIYFGTYSSICPWNEYSQYK